MNSKAIRKQLLAAVAMVLVAAVALGSSTYAWFVASGTVKATDMKVTVQSEGGIMIRGISEDGTETSAWGTVATAVNTGTVSLYPTSTHNLTDWVHAFSAHADNADAKQTAAGAYKAVDTKDLSKYRRLDTFAIRSSSGQDIAGARIKITGVTAKAILAEGASAVSTNLNKSIRVGVRVDTSNGGRAPGAGDDGAAFYVYAPNADSNFELVAKYAGDAPLTENKEPTAKDYLYMTGNKIPGAEAGVRVQIFTWYEGEDENCKNTSLVNGNNPLVPDNLNITVTFEQDTMPTATPTTKVDMTGATVDMNTSQTIGSTPYYKINKQLDGKDLYTTDRTLTSSSLVYTITDGAAEPVTDKCDMSKIGA